MSDKGNGPESLEELEESSSGKKKKPGKLTQDLADVYDSIAKIYKEIEEIEGTSEISAEESGYDEEDPEYVGEETEAAEEGWPEEEAGYDEEDSEYIEEETEAADEEKNEGTEEDPGPAISKALQADIDAAVILDDRPRRRPRRPRRKMSRKVKWTLISVTAFLLIAGGICGYLVYRFFQNIREEVVIEAGEEIPGKAAFLLEDRESTSCRTDLSAINSRVPGEYPVELTWGPLSAASKLIIRDTKAPVGEVQELVRTLGDRVTAEDFVTCVSDETEVKIRFVMEPDQRKEGEMSIGIKLEDQGGNMTILSTKLTIYDPNKNPVIRGVKNINIFLGESISYRAGVNVLADESAETVLEIDNSAVDPDTPGSYPVTYTATDKYGRTSTVEIRVNVSEKPDNYEDQVAMEARADEILKELITNGMSDIEKLFAIFRYVRLHIPWNRGRTEHDYIGQANRGFDGEVGDCYTHAVTCQVLLDRAGFLNIMIEKNTETGMHYWLLVYYNGFWYHMDPSNIYITNFVTFLSTDEQIQEYAAQYRPGLYDIKERYFPETPPTSPAEVVYREGDYYLTILE